MSDKVNLTNLIALRDKARANPKDLSAMYLYTKAVMDAADVLVDLATADVELSESGKAFAEARELNQHRGSAASLELRKMEVRAIKAEEAVHAVPSKVTL